VEVERKERELLTIARRDRATRESRRGNKFPREFFRESGLPFLLPEVLMEWNVGLA